MKTLLSEITIIHKLPNCCQDCDFYYYNYDSAYGPHCNNEELYVIGYDPKEKCVYPHNIDIETPQDAIKYGFDDCKFITDSE